MMLSADIYKVCLCVCMWKIAVLINSSRNLIHAVQKEDVLYVVDSREAAAEEDEELAWQRVADLFEMMSSKYNEGF